MKAKVMPDGRISLPVDLRRRHGLDKGGDVIVEDTGDAIVLRTLDQVVARAQEMSRRLIGGKAGGSVDDFLDERRRDAEAECRPSCSMLRRSWPCSSASRAPIR